MQLEEPPRRQARESIVPMINVVFLLLIFFLMTATIAPPDPVDVEAPSSASDRFSDDGQALIVASDGTLAWGEARRDAALQAAARAWLERQEDGPLIIKADRDVRAQEIARLLRRLADLGVTRSELVTQVTR